MKSKNTKQFDLHLHSYYSDGKDSPLVVLKRAKKAGLKLVSLTDHNTLEHLPYTQKAAKKLKIKILTGVEINVLFQKRQLHLLGYGFNPQNKSLQKTLLGLQARRKKEIFTGIKKLQKQGFQIKITDLDKFRADYWGLAHLIRALLSRPKNRRRVKKEIGNLGDFNIINHYFTRGNPFFIPEKLPPATKIIQVLKQAGAVVTLAHPGFHLAFREDGVIKALKKYGISALEVFTPKHNFQQITHYEALANKLGLAITAGSDYHLKIHKDKIPLGSPVGLLKLPPTILDNFLKTIKQK